MALGEDFQQVLDAARAGAEWAWTALYRDLAPLVLRYLRAGGSINAEDVTGEVFVNLVGSLGRFEGTEQDFRTWVLTIAHRRLIDERRRVARRREAATPADEIARAGSLGNVEEEAMRALQEARVQELLATLTFAQRDVLVLRILAGLSVEEVASVVGKRPGAVKALQWRALAALRRVILSGAVPV